MSISNEDLIVKAMEFWLESQPGVLTNAQGIQTLVANTSPDRSAGYIDNFLYEVTTKISEMSDSELYLYFPDGHISIDREEINRVVIEAVRDLTTTAEARTVTDNDFAEQLSEIPRLKLGDDDTVLRIGHKTFVEYDHFNSLSNLPSVVPSSLMVRRSHLNKKIDTVRSSSSPVAIAHDSVESISVDLIFPDIDSLNIHFRELFSMANMTPVLMLESPLITKAFINETDFPEIYNRAVAKKLNNNPRFAKIVEGVANDAVSSLENAIELSRTNDPFIDVIFDRIKIEAEQYYGDSEDEIVDADALIRKVSTAIGVAVESISLQTLPNNPGAFMARVSFTRANIPMLEKGQPIYLDGFGNPTHSPDSSPWMKKFSRTLMDKNIAKDRCLQRIDQYVDGWDDFTLEWSNIFGQEKTVKLNSPNSVETQVSVTTGFRVAKLNLLNASAPLVQQMGRVNVEGVIVIETTDLDIVEKLSKAKAEIKTEAKQGLVKRNSAEVTHPILNLMGVKRISITDIAFQETQEAPNLRTITIGFVENALNINDVESLKLESGDINEESLIAFWDYCRDLLDASWWTKNRGSYDEWQGSLQEAEKFSFNVVDRLFNSKNTESPGLFALPYITSVVGHVTGLVTGFAGTFRQHLVRAALNRAYFVRTKDRSYEFYKSEADKDMDEDLAKGLTMAAEVAHRLFRKPELKSISVEDENAARILLTVGYDVSYSEDSEDTAIISASSFPRPVWDAMLFVIRRGDGDFSVDKYWSSLSMKTALATISTIIDSPDAGRLVNIPVKVMGGRWIVYRVREIQTKYGAAHEVTQRNKAATNYTDLPLPTYEELFSGSKDRQGNPVWKKFAPTYRDLGVRPPLNDSTAYLSTADAFSEVAHKETDLVTPNAFFYKPRVKQYMEKALTEDIKETHDSFDSIGRVVRIPIDYRGVLEGIGAETFNGVEDDSDTVKAVYELISDRIVNNQSDEWEDASINYKNYATNKDVKVIDIVTADGRPVVTYTKDADGKLVAKISIGKRNIFKSSDDGLDLDPQSPKDLNRLLGSSIEHLPDNTSNMDRSFPAIRIYLVEEDRTFRTLFDDLYAISAIQSVSVTKDKYDADTAVIKLSNTSGYLSEDSFIPKGVDNRIDDDGEPFLSRFKVSYGTHIVVKMGYAARPDELKTVFTGAVAEIGGGESISIVAQGFKTELFNEVGHFAEGYSWDHINRPHLRNVINNVLKRNGDAPHLGKRIDLHEPHSEDAGKLLRDVYGNHSGYDTTLWNPVRYAFEALGGKKANDIGRNIYYDTNTSFHTEFAIPTMTCMDAIHECVKYMPNFVADVVPYGVDATLFVGDPAGHYQYRSTTREEKSLYEEAAREENRDLVGLEGAFTDMINEFLDSLYYEDYSKNVAVMANLGAGAGIEAVARDIAIGKEIRSEKDLFGQVSELEKTISGLKRKLFAYFFGFNPNVIEWPRGLQGQWRGLNQALLSSWRAGGEFSSAYYNSIAYLSDDADETTRLTIDASEIQHVINPEFLGEAEREVRFPVGSGAAQANSARGLSGTSTVDFIYRRAINYKLFIEYVVEFLQKQPIENLSEIQKPRNFGAEMPPGYKTFREYHFISSEQDIIENNIVASDSEMWNAAALKAPACVEADGLVSTMWNWVENAKGLHDPDHSTNQVVLDPAQTYVLWPAAPNTTQNAREGLTFKGTHPKGADIVRVFHEPNALTPHAAATVLNHRLCEGMSKMYRGNVIIAGKAIKPYDVIHIRDAKNNIVGNFEAERVTHNFDPNFGWTSVVIPNALTFNNAHFAHRSVGFWAEMWNVVTSDELQDFMLFASLAVMVASTVATGGVAAPVVTFLGNLARQAGRALLTRSSGRIATALAATGRGVTVAGGFTGGAINTIGGIGSRIIVPAGGLFALHAGDRVFGKAIREMVGAGVQQSIGGNKYPILVQPMVYQGRPYTAGFRVTEYDFDTDFWERFGRLLGDAYRAGADLFTAPQRTHDINSVVDQILENNADG